MSDETLIAEETVETVKSPGEWLPTQLKQGVNGRRSLCLIQY